MGPPFLMSPLPGTPIPGQPFPSISIPKDSHPGNSRPCNPPLPATPNPENPHHGDPHSPGPPSDVTPPPQHLQFPGHPSLAPYSPQDSKICQHHVPPHTPPCPHPAPTQGHQHVGTRRDLASCPPPRAQVAPAACDSQPGWPGTAGWPGRWRCSCGPRPSASLVSPRGDATSPPRCPHPALALAGWCPLSPAGAQTTQLLVEPPWTPPVLWDRVTLTCQGSGTAAATTWHKDGQRWRLQGPDRFVVTESGTYQCHRPGTGLSPPVSVSNAWLVLQVPARALLEGDTVTLRCRGWQDKPVTSVSFYHEEKQLQRFRDGTELSLSPLRLHHSGRYRCRGSVYYEGWKESAPVTVTVHVPVANATISPGALAQPVRAGDPVTLRCSVQVGSAPVTFTWLRNGSEVARGPLLELGDVHVGHSGTYQCVATNQLGQDGHRVFRALSPELALTVTPRAHWDTAVAAGVTGSLLFLVLLVGVIVGWHRWQRLASRKHQERGPPARPPRDPQVTNTELRGPHWRLRERGGIYENVP
ncbi:Fc receptor-like protein 4 isoform X14 [Corvus hawaiiensis]|uniref:Fc receptor-like protein 4 isoform X14 n=1 Tax=Corvus hawaiiensis TaxID=134902 RepID=UPI0020190AE5|nr:Fc receptor-like protein 4 isoform X14 [Corvus hawaiiensis]